MHAARSLHLACSCTRVACVLAIDIGDWRDCVQLTCIFRFLEEGQQRHGYIVMVTSCERACMRRITTVLLTNMLVWPAGLSHKMCFWLHVLFHWQGGLHSCLWALLIRQLHRALHVQVQAWTLSHCMGLPCMP